MNVVGGNPNAAMSGVNEQTGKVNYYRGKSSGDWQTDVKTYSKVRAADVYRGIDAVYYTNEQRAVEYDFIVAPNADPNQIKLDFSGAKKLQIDGENGDLIIKTSGGEIRGSLTRFKVTRSFTVKPCFNWELTESPNAKVADPSKAMASAIFFFMSSIKSVFSAKRWGHNKAMFE